MQSVVLLLCGGRFSHEAEARGSVSYTVNGFQSVQPFGKAGGEAGGGGDVFSLCSPSSVLLEPCTRVRSFFIIIVAVVVVQFQMEIDSHRYSFPGIVQVGGRMRHLCL